MTTEDSVVEVLARLRAGDAAAAERLWNQFFANLCGVARNRLRGGKARLSDEEDVALSAFASVCRRIGRGDFAELRSRDDLWRLLAKVTENKALSLLRNEARQKRGGGKVSGESVSCSFDSSAGWSIDAIASAEPSPAFVAEMTETVRAMFGALNDQSRQVALLRLEGERNEDIALKLGRSVATVERKLKLIRAVWSAHEAAQESS